MNQLSKIWFVGGALIFVIQTDAFNDNIMQPFMNTVEEVGRSRAAYLKRLLQDADDSRAVFGK